MSAAAKKQREADVAWLHTFADTLGTAGKPLVHAAANEMEKRSLVGEPKKSPTWPKETPAPEGESE